MHKMMYGIRTTDRKGIVVESGWTTNLRTNLGQHYTILGKIETNPKCNIVTVQTIKGIFLEQE